MLEDRAIILGVLSVPLIILKGGWVIIIGMWLYYFCVTVPKAEKSTLYIRLNTELRFQDIHLQIDWKDFEKWKKSKGLDVNNLKNFPREVVAYMEYRDKQRRLNFTPIQKKVNFYADVDKISIREGRRPFEWDNFDKWKESKGLDVYDLTNIPNEIEQFLRDKEERIANYGKSRI